MFLRPSNRLFLDRSLVYFAFLRPSDRLFFLDRSFVCYAFLRLSNRLFPIEDLQKCEVYRVPFEPALNPSCCMRFPRRPRRPYFAFSIPMRSFLISRVFLDFSYSFLSFDFAFFAPSPPFVYFAFFFASSLSLTFKSSFDFAFFCLVPFLDFSYSFGSSNLSARHVPRRRQVRTEPALKHEA